MKKTNAWVQVSQSLFGNFCPQQQIVIIEYTLRFCLIILIKFSNDMHEYLSLKEKMHVIFLNPFKLPNQFATIAYKIFNGSQVQLVLLLM